MKIRRVVLTGVMAGVFGIAAVAAPDAEEAASAAGREKTAAATGDEIRDEQGRLLDEVVVEADRVRQVKDGMEFMPTKREQRAAFDLYSLIRMMPISSVITKPGGEGYSTPSGSTYTVFINGLPAEEWELKTIKPTDVLGVEVLSNPTSPEYFGYNDVLNIRLRRYEYGAYILADARQNFLSNYNDHYGVNAKYERGRWSILATVGADLTKSESTDESVDRYRFDDTPAETVRRSLSSTSGNDNNEKAIVKAIYRTPSVTITNTAGTAFCFDRPHSTTYGHTEYDGDATTALDTYSHSNNRSNSVYYTFTGQFALPGEGRTLMAYGSVNYGTSSNDRLYEATSALTGAQVSQIIDDSRNKTVNTHVRVTYMKTYNSARHFAARVGGLYNWLSNRYSGTTVADITRRSGTAYGLLQYGDRIGSANILAYGNVQVFTMSSPGQKSETYVLPSLTGTVSGKAGTTGSYNAFITYSTVPSDLFNYAGVARQLNEIDGFMPNYVKKTEHRLQLRGSYTRVFSRRFNISPGIFASHVINAPTQTYRPVDGVMNSYVVRDGSYTSVAASIHAALSLPGDRVTLSASAGYQHDSQTGTNAADVDMGTFTLSADYIPVNGLSINLLGMASVPNRRYSQGGGGGYFYSKRHDYTVSLTASYSIRNLQVQVRVENPWVGTNPRTTTRDGIYYSSWSRNCTNMFSSSRYIGLSLRYLFNIGKKIEVETQTFEGSSASDR